MGEIAEMMLDGTLCEGCGDYLGDAVDFSRLCVSCAKDRRKAGHNVDSNGLGGFVDCGEKRRPIPKKCKCQTCGKNVKEIGLTDHMRDAHGISK